MLEQDVKEILANQAHLENLVTALSAEVAELKELLSAKVTLCRECERTVRTHALFPGANCYCGCKF